MSDSLDGEGQKGRTTQVTVTWSASSRNLVGLLRCCYCCTLLRRDQTTYSVQFLCLDSSDPLAIRALRATVPVRLPPVESLLSPRTIQYPGTSECTPTRREGAVGSHRTATVCDHAYCFPPTLLRYLANPRVYQDKFCKRKCYRAVTDFLKLRHVLT